MDIVEKAVLFAVQAHSGMTRKRMETPYIVHPMEACSIAATMTKDRDILAAALLHDTVEDTDTTIDDIEELFGKRIRDLVASETEDKREELPPEETWKIRKEESLEKMKNAGRDVHILWISDKLSNIRAFHQQYVRDGVALWNNFHMKDPKMQEWYYRTVAEYTSDLSDEVAWQEYKLLVDIIFGEEGNYYD